MALIKLHQVAIVGDKAYLPGSYLVPDRALFGDRQNATFDFLGSNLVENTSDGFKIKGLAIIVSELIELYRGDVIQTSEEIWAGKVSVDITKEGFVKFVENDIKPILIIKGPQSVMLNDTIKYSYSYPGPVEVEGPEGMIADDESVTYKPEEVGTYDFTFKTDTDTQTKSTDALDYFKGELVIPEEVTNGKTYPITASGNFKFSLITESGAISDKDGKFEWSVVGTSGPVQVSLVALKSDNKYLDKDTRITKESKIVEINDLKVLEVYPGLYPIRNAKVVLGGFTDDMSFQSETVSITNNGDYFDIMGEPGDHVGLVKDVHSEAELLRVDIKILDRDQYEIFLGKSEEKYNLIYSEGTPVDDTVKIYSKIDGTVAEFNANLTEAIFSQEIGLKVEHTDVLHIFGTPIPSDGTTLDLMFEGATEAINLPVTIKKTFKEPEVSFGVANHVDAKAKFFGEVTVEDSGSLTSKVNGQEVSFQGPAGIHNVKVSVDGVTATVIIPIKTPEDAEMGLYQGGSKDILLEVGEESTLILNYNRDGQLVPILDAEIHDFQFNGESTVDGYQVEVIYRAPGEVSGSYKVKSDEFQFKVTSMDIFRGTLDGPAVAEVGKIIPIEVRHGNFRYTLTASLGTISDETGDWTLTSDEPGLSEVTLESLKKNNKFLLEDFSTKITIDIKGPIGEPVIEKGISTALAAKITFSEEVTKAISITAQAEVKGNVIEIQGDVGEHIVKVEIGGQRLEIPVTLLSPEETKTGFYLDGKLFDQRYLVGTTVNMTAGAFIDGKFTEIPNIKSKGIDTAAKITLSSKGAILTAVVDKYSPLGEHSGYCYIGKYRVSLKPQVCEKFQGKAVVPEKGKVGEKISLTAQSANFTYSFQSTIGEVVNAKNIWSLTSDKAGKGKVSLLAKVADNKFLWEDFEETKDITIEDAIEPVKTDGIQGILAATVTFPGEGAKVTTDGGLTSKVEGGVVSFEGEIGDYQVSINYGGQEYPFDIQILSPSDLKVGLYKDGEQVTKLTLKEGETVELLTGYIKDGFIPLGLPAETAVIPNIKVEALSGGLKLTSDEKAPGGQSKLPVVINGVSLGDIDIDLIGGFNGTFEFLKDSTSLVGSSIPFTMETPMVVSVEADLGEVKLNGRNSEWTSNEVGKGKLTLKALSKDNPLLKEDYTKVLEGEFLPPELRSEGDWVGIEGIKPAVRDFSNTIVKADGATIDGKRVSFSGPAGMNPLEISDGWTTKVFEFEIKTREETQFGLYRMGEKAQLSYSQFEPVSDRLDLLYMIDGYKTQVDIDSVEGTVEGLTLGVVDGSLVISGEGENPGTFPIVLKFGEETYSTDISIVGGKISGPDEPRFNRKVTYDVPKGSTPIYPEDATIVDGVLTAFFKEAGPVELKVKTPEGEASKKVTVMTEFLSNWAGLTRPYYNNFPTPRAKFVNGVHYKFQGGKEITEDEDNYYITLDSSATYSVILTATAEDNPYMIGGTQSETHKTAGAKDTLSFYLTPPVHKGFVGLPYETGTGTQPTISGTSGGVFLKTDKWCSFFNVTTTRLSFSAVSRDSSRASPSYSRESSNKLFLAAVIDKSEALHKRIVATTDDNFTNNRKVQVTKKAGPGRIVKYLQEDTYVRVWVDTPGSYDIEVYYSAVDNPNLPAALENTIKDVSFS